MHRCYIFSHPSTYVPSRFFFFSSVLSSQLDASFGIGDDDDDDDDGFGNAGWGSGSDSMDLGSSSA